MKNVQVVRRPNGVVDLYLRKRGLPVVRLKAPLPEPGCEAGSLLEREVTALLKALGAANTKGPVTLESALRDYELRDPKFLRLGAATKVEYRACLKEFSEDLGLLPIATLTPAFVQDLMVAWAARGYRAANVRRQVLKNVLKPCLIAGTLDKNPFDLVGNVERPAHLEEPHILWPMDVMVGLTETAIERGHYGLAAAIVFGRYVGARRADIVSAPKSLRTSPRITFRSGKRRVLVDIPIDPELKAWFARIPDRPDETPRQGRRLKKGATAVTPFNLVFTLEGRPYSEDGLGAALADLVSDPKLHNITGGLRYDLHGLRHTRGVELALAGCTDAEGAAQLGHSSPNSFAQYRRQADRIRLADDAAAKIAQLRERRQKADPEQLKREV